MLHFVLHNPTKWCKLYKQVCYIMVFLQRKKLIGSMVLIATGFLVWMMSGSDSRQQLVKSPVSTGLFWFHASYVRIASLKVPDVFPCMDPGWRGVNDG